MALTATQTATLLLLSTQAIISSALIPEAARRTVAKQRPLGKKRQFGFVSSNLFRGPKAQEPLKVPGIRHKYSTSALFVHEDETLLEYLDGGDSATFEEFMEQQRRERFLRGSPMFERCSRPVVSRISHCMIPESYPAGKQVIFQGDSGTAMYFVKSGTLEAVRSLNGTDEVLFTYSTEGDVFGELSLLFDQPRSATVTAKVDSEVYRLEKDDFLESVVNESPVVWDTAREIILRKYKSQRLVDTLPSIQLDELIGLLKVRLIGRFTAKRLTKTFTTFSLGAAAMVFTIASSMKLASKAMVYFSLGLLAYLLN